jgi:hypothetical protein
MLSMLSQLVVPDGMNPYCRQAQRRQFTIAMAYLMIEASQRSSIARRERITK